MALNRIELLLGLAESKSLDRNARGKQLAQRYVNLSRRISEHYKVKMPKQLKYRVCKGCNNFLIPGLNCQVKVASSHGYVAYMCECGRESHVFYKRR